MNTQQNETGGFRIVTRKQIMEMLSIGHTTLDILVAEGMPRICLNPGEKCEWLRRYRYNPQAVLAWLESRQMKNNTQQ